MSAIWLAERLSSTFGGLQIEANYRVLAMLSALLFAAIVLVLKKRGGIDWYPMVHAFVAASGSLICIWLDMNASSIDPGDGLKHKSSEL